MEDYTIYAKLNIEVTTTVRADNLGAALERAKGLQETDFVRFGGDYIDGDMRIVGIVTA